MPSSDPTVYALHVLKLLARSPCRVQDLAEELGVSDDEVGRIVKGMKAVGLEIQSKRARREQWYWIEPRPLAQFLGLPFVRSRNLTNWVA